MVHMDSLPKLWQFVVLVVFLMVILIDMMLNSDMDYRRGT